MFETLADTPERADIRDAVRAICNKFDDTYWAEKARTHSFPFEFAACSTVHINSFGLHSIVKHGTDEQKKQLLPSIIDGSSRACFGVTEPDAGLDTSKIKTRAVLQGDKYIVHGQKIWTST